MGCYGRDLAVNPKQLIDGHLGRSHRILDRKYHIVRDFDELADKGEVPRPTGTGSGRSPVRRGMNMLVM